MHYTSELVEWGNLAATGALLEQVHILRKRLFIDKLNWDLPSHGDFEFDQYDTPSAKHIVALNACGDVVAATRLIRTDTMHGNWRYMIKDACDRRLSDMPSDLMNDPPTCAEIWEATRFTVSDNLTQTEKNAALKVVCEAAVRHVHDQNGREILGLMSPFFLKWLTRSGFEVKAAGPTKLIDGQPFCVISYTI